MIQPNLVPKYFISKCISEHTTIRFYNFGKNTVNIVKNMSITLILLYVEISILGHHKTISRLRRCLGVQSFIDLGGDGLDFSS